MILCIFKVSEKIRRKFSVDSIWDPAPKIFFVPKIYPGKAVVIGVFIDRGVKKNQKRSICTCSTTPSVASKRNPKLMFAFC